MSYDHDSAIRVRNLFPSFFRPPTPVTGHQEPSTLHHAREKSLDVEDDSKKPNTPGRDLTCYLRFRKPSLYPLSYEGEVQKALKTRAFHFA